MRDRWLCWEAAANLSLYPNSLISGKIPGISLDTPLPACMNPLKHATSLDGFPAIGTGNFLLQTGKIAAANSESGMLVVSGQELLSARPRSRPVRFPASARHRQGPG